MDMTPRTARRYLIHQHREGKQAEGEFSEKEVEGQHYKHRHERGSHMCAESLAILHKKQKEKEETDAIDPSMEGFLVGDRVETTNGPDHEGPWKEMGEGTVHMRNQYAKKHYLTVFFPLTGDAFNIKACNLYNITDPSRSGEFMLPKKYRSGSKESRSGSKASRSGSKKNSKENLDPEPETTEYVDEKVRREVLKAFETRKSLVADADDIEAIEMRRLLWQLGIEIGDTVAPMGNMTDAHGIVVAPGKRKGEVMVRLGDLGIRAFKAVDLKVLKTDEERCGADADELAQIKKDRAAKAARIDPDDRKPWTLTTGEAGDKFDEVAVDRRAKSKCKALQEVPDEAIVKKEKQFDPMYGFRKGDFVKVADASNPMWATLGIGVCRGPGDKPGTMQVQFESGGEYWTLFIEQLEQVKKADATDRTWKQTDDAQLRKRQGVKK